MDISFDDSQLRRNLDEFPNRFNAALEMYGQTAASYLQAEAKANRPWTDRTNRARLGLTGSEELKPDELVIVLAHTVDYGLWLELAHEKNYAIVEPTVQENRQKIVDGLEGMLNSIKMR